MIHTTTSFDASNRTDPTLRDLEIQLSGIMELLAQLAARNPAPMISRALSHDLQWRISHGKMPCPTCGMLWREPGVEGP